MELVVLTHNSPPFSHCCISRFFFKFISSLICTTPSSSSSSSSSSFVCKMEPNKAQGKRSLDFKIEEEEAEEDEEEDSMSRPSVLELHGEDERRKRVMVMNGTSATSPSKKAVSGAGGSTTTRPSCQAQSCIADLSDVNIVKQYYRRHKVCDFHSKAPVVIVGGLQQRFCQQCSRFHNLSEFDENKRSCRRRLAGHNERRRKSSSDYPN